MKKIFLKLVLLFLLVVPRTALATISWNGSDLDSLFEKTDAVASILRRSMYADEVKYGYTYNVEASGRNTAEVKWSRTQLKGVESAVETELRNAPWRYSARARTALLYYVESSMALLDVDTNIIGLAIHDRADAFNLIYQTYLESKRQLKEIWSEEMGDAEWKDTQWVLGLTPYTRGVLGASVYFDPRFQSRRGVVFGAQFLYADLRSVEPFPDRLGATLGAGFHIGDFLLLPGIIIRGWDDADDHQDVQWHASVAYWRRGVTVGLSYSSFTGVGMQAMVGLPL